MDKLWCFGDSYCEVDANWIYTIRKSLNLKLGSVGEGGSSLLAAYNRIIEKKDLIKKNDRVLFCFTAHVRDLFNRKNYSIGPTGEPVDYNYHNRKEVIAYQEYITHLYTDKIAIVPSISDSYKKHSYIKHDWDKYPTLFKFQWEYLDKKYPNSDDEFIYSFIKSPIPNHWVQNDKEYDKLFWKTYKGLLEPLQFESYPTQLYPNTRLI